MLSSIVNARVVLSLLAKFDILINNMVYTNGTRFDLDGTPTPEPNKELTLSFTLQNPSVEDLAVLLRMIGAAVAPTEFKITSDEQVNRVERDFNAAEGFEFPDTLRTPRLL